MGLTGPEAEYARLLIPAETDWPGLTDPGEPEATTEEIDRGWERLTGIVLVYGPRIGVARAGDIETAMGEATADYARAGWDRATIRTRLEAMIEDWE